MKFLLHRRKAFSGGWDLSTVSGDEYFTVEYNTMSGFYMKSDGLKLFIVKSNAGSGYAQQYDLSTAWDVTTAVISKSLNMGILPDVPICITFNFSGTVMYIGEYGSDVYQYNLSTGWDLNTAAYNQTIDVSGTVSGIVDLIYNVDGTKLYILSNATDRVYQFSLSTAYDISTNSYDSKSFSVSSQATSLGGLAFKTDGKSLYVSDSSDGKIYQYDLSTPWDVSTASYITNCTIGTYLYNISFKVDGKMLFALKNNSIYQYNLS